jgi:flagellar biosynthetic protein FliQ
VTPDGALSIAQEAIRIALFVGAPVLGFGLAAGLLVSLFQATTQINESSLQFLPKVLAALVGLVIFGPWMLTTMIDFTRNIIQMLPQMAR